jgi:uncharacterized protein
MRRELIALLGDTHLPRGSRRLPRACTQLLSEAALVLHTGDFTTSAALGEMRGYGPLHAVHGNMDDPAVQTELPERRVVQWKDLRIGLVHDAGPRSGRHERLLAWFSECHLVAYGHTHLPEVTKVGTVWIVNPGSPTERRRAAGHTMAVLRRGQPVLVEPL